MYQYLILVIVLFAPTFSIGKEPVHQLQVRYISTSGNISIAIDYKEFYSVNRKILLVAPKIKGYHFEEWSGNIEDLALLEQTGSSRTFIFMPERNLALKAINRKQ